MRDNKDTEVKKAYISVKILRKVKDAIQLIKKVFVHNFSAVMMSGMGLESLSHTIWKVLRKHLYSIQLFI